MNVWTIEAAQGQIVNGVPYAGFSPVTLAEFGLKGCGYAFCNQQPDTFTATMPRSDLGNLLGIPYESNIKIKCRKPDGSVRTFFNGYYLTDAASFDPGTSEIQFVLNGPWYLLETQIFVQQRKAWTLLPTPTDYDYETPFLILPWRFVPTTDQPMPTGVTSRNQLTIGEQIFDAVNWLNTVTPGVVSVSQSNITPDAFIPLCDQRGLTCAEVVRLMLRWCPDAVCWFDHTTTPPTFYCRRQSSAITPAQLRAVTLTIGDLRVGNRVVRNVKAGRIRKRSDLQRSSVVIYYERTGEVNNSPKVEIIPQVYPPGDITARTRERGSLLDTVNLSGARLTYSETPLQSVRLPTDLEAGTTWASVDVATGSTQEWWLDHVGWLTDSSIKSVTIREVEVEVNANSPLPTGKYWCEIVAGSASRRMGAQARIRIKAEVDYTKVRPDGSIAKKTKPTQPRKITVNVHCTSYDTDNVFRIISSTQVDELPEPIPEWSYGGTPVTLAEFLYRVLNDLPFEGSVTIQQEEVDPDLVKLGDCLNLDSVLERGTRKFPIEWATMMAPVQGISGAIDNGRAEVSFGPPKHYSLHDLVELLRMSRDRNRKTSPRRLLDGTLGPAERVELPEATSMQNSDAGTSDESVISVQDESDGTELKSTKGTPTTTNTVTLDARSPAGARAVIALADAQGKSIELREMPYYERDAATGNCTTRKIIVLASEVYD